MVEIGGGAMAPSGVIYDLEKKHRVTMIMIQTATKTNKITNKLNKKNTTNPESRGPKKLQHVSAASRNLLRIYDVI